MIKYFNSNCLPVYMPQSLTSYIITLHFSLWFKAPVKSTFKLSLHNLDVKINLEFRYNALGLTVCRLSSIFIIIRHIALRLGSRWRQRIKISFKVLTVVLCIITHTSSGASGKVWNTPNGSSLSEYTVQRRMPILDEIQDPGASSEAGVVFPNICVILCLFIGHMGDCLLSTVQEIMLLLVAVHIWIPTRRLVVNRQCTVGES